MDPCTLSWMTILHILINNKSFLRYTLSETWDVCMDIPIVLQIMILLLGYLKVLGKCYSLNFHKLKIIPCPRTIFCDNFEKNNLLGDILNAGDNVDDPEYYGCIG